MTRRMRICLESNVKDEQKLGYYLNGDLEGTNDQSKYFGTEEEEDLDIAEG